MRDNVEHRGATELTTLFEVVELVGQALLMKCL